ncbi:MAG: hypothetical protein IJ583_02655 [Firmicutes bacterium]|nr:hypothetical protein [Bacillota bacterium]
MRIIIAANTKKAELLNNYIKGSEFLYLKDITNKLSDNKYFNNVIILPCFIYKGYEYDNAVIKIKKLYPNAKILPPLISSQYDYYTVRKILKKSKDDIFCIHSCKNITIKDSALWKIGKSTDKIIKYIQKNNFHKVNINLILIDSLYHLSNDIPILLNELSSNNIVYKIKMYSVLDNENIRYMLTEKIKKYSKKYSDKNGGNILWKQIMQH